jgi:thioredoxin-like negative regulator of GroEL
MLRITAITFLLAVAAPAFVSPAAEAATWETTLERGSAAAVKAGKPMLIEFWADWCPPCRVMDAEVYPHPRVSKAMSKVQWVRVDVDKQERVSRQYNVTGMPTIVFADSYGTELFRFTGTLTADTLVQLLKELPSDVREINRLSQTVARDKNNFGALENLGRVLRAAALYRSSNVYYSRAIDTRATPEQKSARGEILVAMGQNDLKLQEFSEASRVFDRYLKEHAGGPAEAEAMLGLGRALLSQNKHQEAKQTLQALTARYKSGQEYREAIELLAGL